ncbi:hypothetical protein CS562_03890 [Paenibacillus sp. LK1]|nr:hypothetical protein CS562_03890 [Paenibacillus sp. LK1]
MVSGEEEILPAHGVFVAIGHYPNTKFLKGRIETDKDGYIVTVPGTSMANIFRVFAYGDVQDPRYRQAITGAGSEVMVAIDSEKFIEKEEVEVNPSNTSYPQLSLVIRRHWHTCSIAKGTRCRILYG